MDHFFPFLSAVATVTASLRKRLKHATVPPLSTAFVAWILLVTAVGLAEVQAMWSRLPDVSDPSVWRAPESLVVLDREGNPLYYSYDEEDRRAVASDDIPQYVKDAFVAIEDERFYERGCIDVEALGRATVANLRDYKSQGASTITQQLVRSALLTRDKTIVRKLKELALACQVERQYSRKEILDLYLNWVSFGHTIAGVKQASTHFFNKDVADLTLAEAAILASMPQRPTYFSPYGEQRYTQLRPGAAERMESGEGLQEEDVVIGLSGTGILIAEQQFYVRGRSDIVLDKMRELGFIDEQERRQARSELSSVAFQPHIRAPDYPHFVASVLDDLSDVVELDEDQQWLEQGWTLRTSLDPTLQRNVELLLEERQQLLDTAGAQNVAMIVSNPHTGEVLAYVGNREYSQTSSGMMIDMARSPRQPGSSFKPFVYLTAMQKKQWFPFKAVWDTPLTVRGQSPNNYDGGYKGLMTLITALNESRNIPAIRAYEDINDEDAILSLADAMGVHTPVVRKTAWQEAGSTAAYGWPLAIGSAEATLWEMVEGYATIARSGTHIPLRTISSITDAHGETLYNIEREQERATQAVPEDIANTMTAMLSEQYARPEGYWRQQTTLPGIDTAVKTGTSNVCLRRTERECVQSLPRDIWAIGYSPDIIVGVWMGNADNTPLSPSATGLGNAIPMWREVLATAQQHMQKPNSQFAGTQAPYYRQQRSIVGPEERVAASPAPSRARRVRTGLVVREDVSEQAQALQRRALQRARERIAGQ